MGFNLFGWGKKKEAAAPAPAAAASASAMPEAAPASDAPPMA